MTKIRAILFDKDGTLFDFNRTWANWSRGFLRDLAGGDDRLARVLADAAGIDLDAAAFARDSILVSHTPREIAAALLPHLPGASLAGIVTRMSTMSAAVRQAEATPLVPLMDELVQRGLRLGVVTNDLEGPTRAHLREAGIDGAFMRVIACDSGFAAKPAPDMLLAFCEMAGLDPEEVVMVGDSAHDMVAARAAGMHRIAVLTGVATRTQLEPLAHAVLPSVAGLPRWLDAQRPGLFAA
ncbi:HAD family hydrolase [Meridianimarinicoccus sp. RP-17]|uniref:HAD family hydrolase n=1 Tax=Meridianimarinicoccus zhengii TaxID=2056810 RepID=UPI000DAC7750|nr:HAD family hydrolase [Phycocomes zhengii]